MVRNKAEYILVICFGFLCLWQTFQIETFETSIVGPRLVPMCIAGMIVFLGILQFIVAWAGKTQNQKVSDSRLSRKNAGRGAVLHTSSVFKILVLLAVGFSYIWMFSAAGYLIATTVIIAFILFLFGTRNPGKIALISIGAGALYYFIFIYLIGIYAPPGWLLNFEMLGF